jgi:hypothetical protein
MMLTRLITILMGVSPHAVRALPPLERMRLAHECRRLLLAADPPVLPPRAPADAVPKQPRSVGILADLADGDRAL